MFDVISEVVHRIPLRERTVGLYKALMATKPSVAAIRTTLVEWDVIIL